MRGFSTYLFVLMTVLCFRNMQMKLSKECLAVKVKIGTEASPATAMAAQSVGKITSRITTSPPLAQPR